MVRVAELEGRPHYVVPMVMITVGTHNGSNGPVYYPSDELERSVPDWNGRAVVVYHPELNGRGVSAGDPDITNRYKIGVIYNTRFDGKRLLAEAWIDQQRVSLVDYRIEQAISHNRQLEVSTGLVMDWDVDPSVGGAVARNYRPDHLAVLPDRVGACSIADGCGLLRNQENEFSDELEDVLPPMMEIVW